MWAEVPEVGGLFKGLRAVENRTVYTAGRMVDWRDVLTTEEWEGRTGQMLVREELIQLSSPRVLA